MTLLLDNLDMIVQFSRFAAPGNDFSEIVLVIAITALQATNYIWFAWILHAKLRMPSVIKGVNTAFIGFSNTLVTELVKNAKESKQNLAKIKDAIRQRNEASAAGAAP